jgi:hypothetical protein
LRSVSGRAVRSSPSRWRRSIRKNTRPVALPASDAIRINVRGFLATQFGLTVHPYADEKIIADFLRGRTPYQCALAIATNNGLTPG